MFTERMRLEHKRRAERECRRRSRRKIIAELGGVCVWCGNDDHRVLQIDHVNGGGSYARRTRFRTEEQRYRAVRENPHLHQLLCANCNAIKKFENHENTGPIGFRG